MKPATPSKPFPESSEEIAAVVAEAPARVEDPETSYDPNDPESIAYFWADATVRRPQHPP